jgi:polyribonucleotide nucleotidyltransferase
MGQDCQLLFKNDLKAARCLARGLSAGNRPIRGRPGTCLPTERLQRKWGGRPLILETGKVARQADGAVMATYGETTVLATVVSAKEAPKPGQDFFPLTVNYQEKTYAAGKIPGGFFKREGRPSEKETLTSRLIDRPIRPLFAEGYKNDTQVIITVLSARPGKRSGHGGHGRASAALTLSGVPFMGPIGGARVGYINGEYVLNPLVDEMEESKLDLVVAGTTDAVLMVESEAKELSEESCSAPSCSATSSFQPVIDAIIKLAEARAKEPRDFQPEDHSELLGKMSGMVGDDLAEGLQDHRQEERKTPSTPPRTRCRSTSTRRRRGTVGRNRSAVFKKLEADIVRGNILKTKTRIDGRDLSTVRPIKSRSRRSAAHPRFGAVHPR